MSPTRWGRWTGLAGLAGGGLFAVAGVLMALRAPGVEGGPHRESGDLWAVMAASLILVVAGMAGLRARDAARLGRLAEAAVGVAAAGAVLALLSGLGQLAGLEALWMAAVLGSLAVFLGSILLGIAALRSKQVPRAAAVLLILSALAFIVGFNTEDARALLTVPFGAAWAWLGYLLWSEPGARRQ